MICEILRVCESGRIPVAGIGVHLRSVSDILDGRPINFDSLEFDEAVRLRSFSYFTNSAVSFCLVSKLCGSEARLIDAGGMRPTEVYYTKVTWFGRIFGKMPYFLQWTTVKAFDAALFVIEALKKYRWVSSVGSLVAGAIAWLKAHDLSGIIILVAVATGILASLAAAWLAHLLGLDADDT